MGPDIPNISGRGLKLWWNFVATCRAYGTMSNILDFLPNTIERNDPALCQAVPEEVNLQAGAKGLPD